MKDLNQTKETLEKTIVQLKESESDIDKREKDYTNALIEIEDYKTTVKQLQAQLKEQETQNILKTLELQKVIADKDTVIKISEGKLEENGKLLEDNRKQIEYLQKALLNKPNVNKPVINNTTYNIQQNFVTVDTLKEIGQKAIKIEHKIQDVKQLAKQMLNNGLNDIITITDKSRDKVTWVNEDGQVVKDDNCKQLLSHFIQANKVMCQAPFKTNQMQLPITT